MSVSIEILNQRVVGPLVRDEKGRADRAAVGVAAIARIEKHFEDFIVDLVDRVLERDENQLRRLLERQLTFGCSWGLFFGEKVKVEANSAVKLNETRRGSGEAERSETLPGMSLPPHEQSGNWHTSLRHFAAVLSGVG